MTLALLLFVLAAAFFWAGFRAPPHPIRYLSRAGLFVAVGLAALLGYFAWREARTISDLAKLIDPVPEIIDVTYVPTTAEVTTLSEFLAAVPGKGRFGTTQEERRDLAKEMRERRTEYWLLKTALPSDSVFAFYRHAAPRRGWNIEADSPPWLSLSRDAETLVLFVTDDFPRPGIRILYGLSVESR